MIWANNAVEELLGPAPKMEVSHQTTMLQVEWVDDSSTSGGDSTNPLTALFVPSQVLLPLYLLILILTQNGQVLMALSA